jgi:hypothetical protein
MEVDRSLPKEKEIHDFLSRAAARRFAIRASDSLHAFINC